MIPTPRTPQTLLKNPVFWVIVLAILVAVILLVATWHMNYWPTDAEDYYIGSAVQLPALEYISQMHESVDRFRSKLLHGKEVFIINAALSQRLFDDYVSLRPLVFVCIISLVFSAVLIFLLARMYWGSIVALMCCLVFLTSFWPYLYILFVKHQPLGLFYFLLSLFFLQNFGKTKIDNRILSLMSGFTFCLSVFSSTISVLYAPYYLAAFVFTFFNRHREHRGIKGAFKNFAGATFLSSIGFLVVFAYLNYPNIAYNVKSFIEHSQISKSYSHFYYNQPTLIQWISHPELSVRGGGEWIIKYFFIIMPVLFPFYLACLAYLLWRCLTVKSETARFRMTTSGLILLSISSPLLAEWRGVAQYGSNYFTSIVGVLMLVGYTVNIFLQSEWFRSLGQGGKRIFAAMALLIFSIHAADNFHIFASDIYPSRMATTFISDTIKKMEIHDLYSYMDHPCRRNMIDSLDPQLVLQLHFLGVANIYQMQDSYILVPPITGNSIYIDSTRNTYGDFDKDIYLNEIFRKGTIQNYAAASFDTLSSSRIWRHEEEVLSYRDLILGHSLLNDSLRGKAWLLDAKKLWADFEKNQPTLEYKNLIYIGIRNIGTQTMVYLYEGEKKHIARPTLMKNFVMKMSKVGEPKDSLVAYVYKTAKDEPVWVPLGNNFSSQPLDGRSLTSDPKGESVKFEFTSPLLLLPGSYRIVIYRTGSPDDKNFYRVYIENPQTTQAAIDATRILPPSWHK